MNLHKLGLLLVLLITAPLCYGVILIIICIMCITMWLFWIVACCEFSCSPTYNPNYCVTLDDERNCCFHIYVHTCFYMVGKYVDTYFDSWEYAMSFNENEEIITPIANVVVSNV